MTLAEPNKYLLHLQLADSIGAIPTRLTTTKVIMV